VFRRGRRLQDSGANSDSEERGVHEWFFRHGGRKRLIDWLGVDAWIDSSLAGAWQAWQDRWNAFSSFFARFRLAGWKRLANEAVSEAITLGAGGLIGLYVLALPALTEFDENRINTGKYAVKFLDRSGAEIGSRGILHNDAVPLEEIPDTLIKATLATEDRRFFEHFGVDFIGTARALLENARANEVVQGGSTLTQQLAKNLFLSSERSIQRKLKEVFLAFLLEARFTKRQILKLYLDRAYMGGGAFGVEAASQFYFGKSVRDINLAESALLAGLYKAPSKFAPHVNLPASRARTNDVLNNLVEAGYMSAGQVEAARLNPAKIIETRPTQSPDWFLDWAFEEVQRIAEGKGQYVLTARITVDLAMQQAAQDALVNELRHTGSSRHKGYTGALVAMEPDGAVRAMVGGLDYEDNQFNRAVHAHRQPGSSFKLYVYATGFENGMNPRSIVRDYGGHCGNWSPKNYSGGSSGRSMAAIDAFRQSLNIPAVNVSLQVGREKVLEMTQRLGVEGVRKTCSMALGDTGIAPLQHTGAYATFANDGKLTRPYAVLELYNSKGDLIYARDRDEPEPRQVISRRVAEQMNQMMRAVVTDGTGKRAELGFTTAIGKSGTSSSYRDAWFMGITGALVAGVWVGYDDFRPMPGITGGSLPAQIWHNFMSVALGGYSTIPPIPGIGGHATEMADVRGGDARRADAAQGQGGAQANASAQGSVAGGAKRSSLMSEQARDTLRRLAQSLRRAAGVEATPVEHAPAAAKPKPPEGKPVPVTPERRADAPELRVPRP
jgi:penicillin-binding protein 1A